MDIHSFFENFKPTDLNNDPLPLKVLNHTIAGSEVDGQSIYWAFQYLHQKNCPSVLLTPLLNHFLSSIRSTSLAFCVAQQVYAPSDEENEDQEGENGTERTPNTLYQPLKLMHVVTTQVDHVCLKWKEDYSLNPDSILAYLGKFDSNINIFDISFCTMKNTRRSLEDRMIILPDLDKLFDIKLEASYFAVFDGHNGVEAAAYAAAQLHKLLIDNQEFPNDIPLAIQKAFELTDTRFLEKCTTENIKSGTTAVLALVEKERIHVAWAGDSQAVLVKSTEIVSLVSPHKPEREDEMQRIRDVGGDVMLLSGTWRVNGNLAVSRAIGDYDYKNYVVSTPEIRVVERDSDDEFLILACDGLWDDISPQRSAKIVRDYLVTKGRDLDGLSQTLASEAKKEGCGDNITIIVVFLQPIDDIISRYSQSNDISPMAVTTPASEWKFKKLNPDAIPFTMNIENLEPEKMDISTNNLEDELFVHKEVDAIDAPLEEMNPNCDDDTDKLLDFEVLSQPDEDWKFQASYTNELNSSVPVDDELEYVKTSTNPFLQGDLSQEINASFEALSTNDDNRLIQFGSEDKGEVIKTDTLEGLPAGESAMLVSLESEENKSADSQALNEPKHSEEEKNQSVHVETVEADAKDQSVHVELQNKDQSFFVEPENKDQSVLLEPENKNELIHVEASKEDIKEDGVVSNAQFLEELSTHENNPLLNVEQPGVKLPDLDVTNTSGYQENDLHEFEDLKIGEDKLMQTFKKPEEPLESVKAESLHLSVAETQVDADAQSHVDYSGGVSANETHKLLQFEQDNDLIGKEEKVIQQEPIEILDPIESEKLLNLEPEGDTQKSTEILTGEKEISWNLDSAEMKLQDPERLSKSPYLDEVQNNEKDKILEVGEIKLNDTEIFIKSENDVSSKTENSTEVAPEAVEIVSKSAAVAEISKSPKVEISQPVSEAKVGNEAKTVKAATNEKIKLGVKNQDSKKPIAGSKVGNAPSPATSATKRPIKTTASPSAKNVGSSPTTTTATKPVSPYAANTRTAAAKPPAASKPALTSPRVSAKTLSANQKSAVPAVKSAVSSTTSVLKTRVVEKKPTTTAPTTKTTESVPRVRSAATTTTLRPPVKTTTVKSEGSNDVAKKESRPARPATSVPPKTATQARPAVPAASRPKTTLTSSSAVSKPKSSAAPIGSSTAASSRTGPTATTSKVTAARKEVAPRPASAVIEKKPAKLDAAKSVPLAKKTVAKSITEPKKAGGGGSINKLPVTRPTATKSNAKDPKLPPQVSPNSTTKADATITEIVQVNGGVGANTLEVSKSHVTPNGGLEPDTTNAKIVTNNEQKLPNGDGHAKVEEEMIDFGAASTEGNNGVVTNGNNGGAVVDALLAASPDTPNLLDF